MVASKSWGAASNRCTMPPARGARCVICRACHLLKEKREVSASAKKKLAPAKSNTTTKATIAAGVMPSACEIKGGKARTAGVIKSVGFRLGPNEKRQKRQPHSKTLARGSQRP